MRQCNLPLALIFLSSFFFNRHKKIIVKNMASGIARPVFDQLLSWVLGKKSVVQIGLGSPKTKFQNNRPINDSLPSIFVFGSIIMVKELLAELKFAIFKNWLDTRPKMETHEPRVYPTILGGVSRGFWSAFLDLGARSAIFLDLKTGTFCQKIARQVSFMGL